VYRITQLINQNPMMLIKNETTSYQCPHSHEPPLIKQNNPICQGLSIANFGLFAH
jgi:hypothetical protein